MIRIEGPGDEIVSTGFHRLHRAVDRAVGGNHNHWGFVAFFAQFFEHFESAQVGHHIV